jgi:hypothetical protein
MNPVKSIVVSGTIATSFMTMFSYAVSEQQKKNFKEPKLLALLLYNLYPQSKKELAVIAGWGLHYSIGIFWTSLYYFLLRRKKKKLSFLQKIFFGTISGIIAILTWKGIFKLHPYPSKINFEEFYWQLLIAHLVFGTTAIKCLEQRL